MTSRKRTAMMASCNKFLKKLEELTDESKVAFSLGKTDFSLDPEHLDKFKIKAEFQLKPRFADEIDAGIDDSQSRLDEYKTD